jgi:ATP-dependent DNA ligase
VESDKARSFKSLLFGAYNGGALTWIGRSGAGFKEEEMPGILATLKKLEPAQSPFNNKVLDLKGSPRTLDKTQTRRNLRIFRSYLIQ